MTELTAGIKYSELHGLSQGSSLSLTDKSTKFTTGGIMAVNAAHLQPPRFCDVMTKVLDLEFICGALISC